MTLLGRNINQDVAEGLDFMLGILPNNSLPRNILVGPYHKPYEVISRDDILYRYEVMSYEDCYINAFPNYSNSETETKPLPNHLMIDLDYEDFTNRQEFEQAVSNIKANISKYITGVTGEHHIIIDSGNGFHIHVPMPGITKSFDDLPEFQKFKSNTNSKPSELDIRFLRYLERKLTGGRSDRRHNPSVNSLMFRIPGTINTKARARGRQDPSVKVVEGYEHVGVIHRVLGSVPSYDYYIQFEASRPTLKLLNDFYLYLVQKKVESRVELFERTEKKLWRSLEPRGESDSNIVGTIPWIEKILQIGVEDQRKDLLFWVLTPYLITIRRLSHEQAFEILNNWLTKCNEVRRLEPGMSDFHRRIDHSINHCTDKLEAQEPWWPISLATFQEYYPKIHEMLTT